MKKYSLFFIFLLSNLISFAQEVKLERFPIEAVKPIPYNPQEKLFVIFIFGDDVPCTPCNLGNINNIDLEIKNQLKERISTVSVFMLKDSIDACIYEQRFPIINTDYKYFPFDRIFPAYCKRNKIDTFPAILFVKRSGEVIDRFNLLNIDSIDYNKLSLILSGIAKSDSMANAINEKKIIIPDSNPAAIISSTQLQENISNAITNISNLKANSKYLCVVDDITKDLISVDINTGKLLKYNRLSAETIMYFYNRDSSNIEYKNAWNKYKHHCSENEFNPVDRNFISNIISLTDTTIVGIANLVSKVTLRTTAQGDTSMEVQYKNVIISMNTKTQNSTVFEFPEYHFPLSNISYTLNNSDILLLHELAPVARHAAMSKGRADTISIASIIHRKGSTYSEIDNINLADLKLDPDQITPPYMQNLISFVSNNNIIFYNRRINRNNKNNLLIYDIDKKKSTQYNIPYLKELDNYIFQSINSSEDCTYLSLLYCHKFDNSKVVILRYNLENKTEKLYSLELPAGLIWADFINSSNTGCRLLIKYGEGIRWRIEEIKL